MSSAGSDSSASVFAPAAGDSSGVKPNLTLAINGIDYYTTGDVPYNGQWIKKGFTYLTGPSQTTLTAMVRNNAPGGGGNDWAIDDIALATCTPNLDLQPSPNLVVCEGNQVDMFTVVNSYFANYTYWEWEKSTDNGVTWTSTGVSGVGTPVLVAGQWQYTATFPTFLASASFNNTMFRIKVASTSGNIGNTTCAFTASTTIQVLTSTCNLLPSGKLIYFKGKNANDFAQLGWMTSQETPDLYFELEKSTDASHFQKIATMNAAGKQEGEQYAYTDNEALTAGATYYRIKLVNGTGYAYSHTITVYSGDTGFEIKTLNNPFDSYLSFDANSPTDQQASISLFDDFGRLILEKQQKLYAGSNRITLSDLSKLSGGSYFLRVQTNTQCINKKIIKIKN